MSDPYIAEPASRREYHVRVRPNGSQVVVTCDSPACFARGATEAEALARMRDEIRYRIELCPCTGVSEEHVQLVIERA